MPGPWSATRRLRFTVARRQGHLDGCVGRRVHAHVGEQVADDLAQPILVATDHDVGLHRGVDRPVWLDRAQVEQRVVDQFAERHLVVAQRPALVEPREQEQVLDECRHAPALAADARHCLAHGLVVGQAAGAVQLRIAAHGRQRRAQLVRCVGHELAQLALAALLGDERRVLAVEEALDLVEHGVNVATLIDFQKGDQQVIENLYKKKLLKKSHVLTFADFTGKSEADIEDMFDEDFYVQLVNEEFSGSVATKLKVGDLTGRSPRILRRLEEYFTSKPLSGGTRFGHYRPARYLAEKVSTLTIPNATLDRFEQAFKAANALLV